MDAIRELCMARGIEVQWQSRKLRTKTEREICFQNDLEIESFLAPAQRMALTVLQQRKKNVLYEVYSHFLMLWIWDLY